MHHVLRSLSVLVALALPAVAARAQAPTASPTDGRAAPIDAALIDAGPIDAAPRGRAHGPRHADDPHRARGPRPPHVRPRPFSPEAIEHRLARLTERLGLDAHQVALAREIFESARADAAPLRDAAPGPARHEAVHALMERTADRIDAILDEPQRARFAEHRAHARARFERRRAQRTGGPDGEPSRAPAPPADRDGI